MSAPRRAAGLSDAAERAGLALMRRADPETAHGLALRALNLRHAAGLSPERGPVTGPGLARRVFGLEFPNPVGIAPGFDKNAVAMEAALAAGPGFMEIGGVTRARRRAIRARACSG